MKKIKVIFDIAPDGSFCEGELTLDKESVTCRVGESERCVSVAEIEEARQFTDVGCGCLELKLKSSAADGSDNIRLCRYSMTCIAQIGEFVKVVNHYIDSGELLEINEKGLPICPKCHRHYMRGMNVCMFCVKKSYVFSRAFGYFKPYLKSVIGATVLLTLGNILSSVMPLFNSVLIDNYLVPTKDATPYFESRATGIVVIAVLMVASFALSKVFNMISTKISNKVGSSFSSDLRSLVYEKAQQMSLTSMSGRSAGNLIHRVTKDTEKVKNFFNEQGKYLIQQTLMFIVVLGILFATEPLLTLLVVVPLPIGIYMLSRFWRATNIRYHKQWRIDSKATSILHDIIKGIRVVKAFGNEDREIDKFSKVSGELAEISASNEKYWSVTFPLVGNFMAIGEFFVLIIGGIMVLKGRLTLGELTRFNLYLGFLYAPMRWMSVFPRRVADASTALVKIYEILDEDITVKSPESEAPFDASGSIVFDNVEFGYKSYEPVIKNMSFEIASGEMIGLVGHSGAGKSTIINLVMRLYDASLGKITIGATDIRDISQETLRNNIGVVFQETYLFSGSVYDNIAYARPDAEREEVIAAAKAAHAHGFITKLPDGYNTVIGENGHSLSGGERQRISIARAILKNPRILILDEATSSLDPETEIEIQQALANLTKGRTTIAIAHRLSTLRNADRLFVIEKGRIVQSGPHAVLANEDGIYKNLVSAQRETSKLIN